MAFYFRTSRIFQEKLIGQYLKHIYYPLQYLQRGKIFPVFNRIKVIRRDIYQFRELDLAEPFLTAQKTQILDKNTLEIGHAVMLKGTPLFYIYSIAVVITLLQLTINELVV